MPVFAQMKNLPMFIANQDVFSLKLKQLMEVAHVTKDIESSVMNQDANKLNKLMKTHNILSLGV